MAFTERSRESIDRIDLMLREDSEFRDIPLTLDGYKAWYALMLGALATVIGEDEAIFARAQYVAEHDSAQLVAFTPTLLTVIDVVGASAEDAEVMTRTVSRRAIRSLRLEISDRHDTGRLGRGLYQWPGSLRLSLEYATLSAPLEFTSRSHDPYSGEPAAVMRLLDGLRQDLATSSQN